MADWHYQADGQPCTAEHFYALACDPQRHAVVEACAGAGLLLTLLHYSVMVHG